MGPRRITEHARAVLTNALAEARRLGLVPDNAAARTEPPARAKPKRPSFTLEECQALFRAAEGERIAPLLRLLLYTGLRRGEALGLKWDDVSWDPPALVVCRQVTVVGGRPRAQEPKTEAGVREVPLVAQAAEALRAQRAAQAEERLRAGAAWRDEGWVFTDAAGGLWDPANVGRSFRRVRGRAGVRPLPLHALRHSAASVLLGAGVEPALAAKVMGHRDLGTFYGIYADLLRPAAQEAARQVERFLEAAEAGRVAPPPAGGRPRRRGRPKGTTC
jgi:integrase